jgi:acyl-CoA dehydrogenase
MLRYLTLASGAEKSQRTQRNPQLSGYRNNTEFSIGPLLRDVLSSAIMIHNDRIISNLSTPTLMTAVPHTLHA